MKSGICRLQVHETEVGPARSMALLVAGLLVLALIALLQSGLNPLTAGMGGCLAGVLGLKSVYRLLIPTLVLRCSEEGLEYRWRKRRWCSTIRSPFVSPWFIGWRGEGLLGFGVFPSQLPEDGFRRLAKALRQGRSGGVE